MLLSKHSAESVWVEREIGAAFSKFELQAATAIIPVRLDKSPLPQRLRAVRYVDLTEGYERAVEEITTRIKRDQKEKVPISSVIDVEDLAANIASERSIPRGAEFYVTALLGILSILATLIAAFPSFQSAFDRTPKVFYDLRAESFSVPAGVDESKILQIIRDAGFAPAVMRIRVINKGHIAAPEVKVGSQTLGSFLFARIEPPVSSKAVWVQVALDTFKPGDKEVVVRLKDLVPEKEVVIDLGYEPTATETSSDVVTSGVLAKKVPDINLLPRQTLWNAIELPLQVLIAGLIFSLFVGVVLASRRNPRLRSKLLDLLDAISPLLARIVRIF